MKEFLTRHFHLPFIQQFINIPFRGIGVIMHILFYQAYNFLPTVALASSYSGKKTAYF